jgi:hypothetical protein
LASGEADLERVQDELQRQMAAEGAVLDRLYFCRGCILVRTGHDVAEALPHLGDPDHVAAGLADAVLIILSACGH